MRQKFVVGAILLGALLVVGGVMWSAAVWWNLVWYAPLLVLGAVDMLQTKHAIRRNFPIIGRLRYFMEFVRPAIQQYFVESDLSGRPFNRRTRSFIYQRAKLETETVPFGTQLDVYEEGYEWMAHSAYPLDFKKMSNITTNLGSPPLT